jgi:hemerythrin
MTRFEWDPAWETGVSIIDRQHRQLVDHAARLLDDVMGGRTDLDVQASLQFLTQFADFHFRDEERIMAEAGYPSLQAHQVEHQALRERLEAMAQKQAQAQGGLTADLVRFVHHWIARHVDSMDRALADFLQARGIDPEE